MTVRKRLITLAAYLPQFHEIPENNLWWGKGFTEWTHLNTARTWFKGHTIRGPSGDFGQYSLPSREVMEKQSKVAEAAGISAFAVWDYWFGAGERLLEAPIKAVLEEKYKFNYVLFWANHSWMNKGKGLTLKRQNYFGIDDYIKYFYDRLPHFQSMYYLKIDNKPIFGLFDPAALPDLKEFIDTWNKHAIKNGFSGIHWVSDRPVPELASQFFDKEGSAFAFWTDKKKLVFNWLKEKLRTKLNISFSPQVYDFLKVTTGQFDCAICLQRYLPTVIAGWDTTPRHGKRGVAFANYEPSAFKAQLERLWHFFSRNEIVQPVVLIKSWNEWAEGNAIEPDNIDGDIYLKLYGDFVRRVNDL